MTIHKPRLNPAEFNRQQRIKDSNVVGIIADTHFPFEHPDYLDFCKDIFDAHRVDQVVQIGDMFDFYFLSFHPTSANAMSGNEEINKAMESKEKWQEVFPEIKILIGNHEARLMRRYNYGLIPSRLQKTINEAFGFPDTWTVHQNLEIDGVLYIHGHGAKGGRDAAINNAIAARQSVVQGHTHLYGGVKYDTSFGGTVFGLNVGCGVDESQYVFSYAKLSPQSGTLGCGVVIGGKEAHFFPMI